MKANSELVHTQSTTVQNTMLDRADHEAAARVAQRDELRSCSCPALSRPAATAPPTVNGLPQNTINITLDGIGIGNNLQSTDGFYTQVFPRMDAVEEVTVTGATPDASAGAPGRRCRSRS